MKKSIVLEIVSIVIGIISISLMIFSDIIGWIEAFAIITMAQSLSIGIDARRQEDNERRIK
jgi:hypothetical protein